MNGDAEQPLPDWLLWTERLRAIAQTGRAYSIDPYDRERYDELNSIVLQMQAALLEEPLVRVGKRFDLDGGYPTPKVEVRAGVFHQDRLLLVREASDGRWALPGGWADQQISPAGNAEKEVREETGLTVRTIKVVAVRNHRTDTYRPPRLEHVFRLLFLCEWTGGELTTSLETSAVEWFSLDALPELSPGRTSALDLALLRDHRQQPALPTWFD